MLIIPSNLVFQTSCRNPLCNIKFPFNNHGSLKDMLYCSDACHKVDYQVKQAGLYHPGCPLITPAPIPQSVIEKRLEELRRFDLHGI